ncbi:serine hydrolase [Pseudotenacibaculum haliotis]|uniref:Serine hydrolase n=1 Tax=Pseudotenacibaculum haliotis TaxID=1862138 RepID=A0ABW5LS58_9FLAO
MKNYTLNIALLLSLLFIVSCSEHKGSPDKPKQVHEKIDHYISSLIKADEIPGMAIAVVKDGQIIHKKNYGLANIAHNVPVTDSTLFRVYSTSKLITIVAIFQLIEVGKISLDDPISKYIDHLPELWQNIKIEHLISYSSGLPEYKDFDRYLSDKSMLAKLAKQALHYPKGYKYEYVQTNFWFLQLIIEKITGQKFEEFVKQNQFKNHSNHVVFASNSLVDIPFRVAKYQYNKEYNAYEKTTYEAGPRSLAGNGLNINLNALLDWNTKLDKDQLLKREIKLKMMSPYKYENNPFPFSHGWGIYGPEGKQYYGFAGGGVSAFMKFIDKDISIIILSNGFRNRPVISDAIIYLSGLSDSDLIREERMLNEDIRLAFILNNYTDALKIYKAIKLKNNTLNFERGLNKAGHHYFSKEQIDTSIAIFKLYTNEYPNSSNAFNNLGDAYFNKKQYALAKENYQKSLELNPKNENAKEMLNKLERGI